MQTRLKEIRKELKMTQQEFADYLGFPKQNICNYEVGRRTPTAATIQLICSKCNVNEDWLRDGTGEKYALQEDEVGAIVAEIIEDKDSEFYRMVLAFAKAYQDLDPKSKNLIDDLIKKALGQE